MQAAGRARVQMGKCFRIKVKKKFENPDWEIWEAPEPQFGVKIIPGVWSMAVTVPTDQRRREELRRSLRNPHPESAELADEGLAAWARGLPKEDTLALVDGSSGDAIRWVPGEGWVESSE